MIRVKLVTVNMMAGARESTVSRKRISSVRETFSGLASPPERESCNEGMAVFSAPSATAGIKTTHSREKMGKSACQLTEKRPRSRSAPADTASACSVVRGDMGRSLAAGSVRFSALLRLESVFPRRAGACQKRGEEHPGISGRSRLF